MCASEGDRDLPIPPDHEQDDRFDDSFHDVFSASPAEWGSGWPDCQGNAMLRVQGGGVVVSVHREIARLVERALIETAKTGYRLKQPQTGAFVCRPIGGTRKASNHSWGLAIDLNWLENPFTSDPNARYTITPEVVAIWKGLGFDWGGDWRNKKDFMHMEWTRSRAEAARRTAALTNPTPTPPTPSKEALMPQVVPSAIIPPDGTPHPFAVGLVEVDNWGPCHVSIEQDLMGAEPGTARVAVGSEAGGFKVVEVPGKSGRQYVMRVPKGNDKAGSVVNRTGADLVVMVEHHPPAG